MKTASYARACRLFVPFAAVLLTSCGGGSGSSSPPPPPGTISFSLSSVSFKAVGPYAAAPAPQSLTGTVTGVTSGTVYYKVVANNAVQNSSNGFFTVSSVTIANDSGQASVIPAIPSSIGAGTFTGTITVSACLNDSTCQSGELAGSPQTIPVEYDIGSGVDGNTVTPQVVAANAAGDVILRGAGFTGATSVSFGSVAAASFKVVSDSEIDASYPSLPAGTYPVTIDSGGISYTASLVAVSPPAFSATLIPYPSGVGGNAPIGIEYDAQRTALFILFPAEISTNPVLVRYAFDGSQWGAPTQLSMAGLAAVHLSPDGTHLLALVAPDSSHTSIVELDPVTLAQTNATTVANPSEADHVCGFALANDGNAIVPLSFSPGFAFGTSSRTFTPLSAAGNCAPVIASGNGAVLALTGATYNTSSETVTSGGADTADSSTADFVGDKLTNFGAVESAAGPALGYVTEGLSDGTVINSAGTRVYSLTQDPVSGAPTLSTFDLTAAPTPPGSQYPTYPVLGIPISLSDIPPTGLAEGEYLGAITPDGGTIFLAGPLDLLVQPVPP